jgi:hypothetical protein
MHNAFVLLALTLSAPVGIETGPQPDCVSAFAPPEFPIWRTGGNGNGNGNTGSNNGNGNQTNGNGNFGRGNGRGNGDGGDPRI